MVQETGEKFQGGILILFVAAFLLPICALVYFAAMATLYGSLDTPVPEICWWGVKATGCMFGSPFIACFLALMGEWEGGPGGIAALTICILVPAFIAMIASFPVNLWYMANLFPYGCLFYDHSGAIDIIGFNATTKQLRTYSGNTDDEGAAWERDWDLVVDCNINMQIFGFWAGGREAIAILAHAFAAIFAAMLKLIDKATDGKADLVTITIDIVDLQDFFQLLLEDDLIVAYWDPELEGDANKRLYWTITVLFFVNGIYLVLWPFLQTFLVFCGCDRENKISKAIKSLASLSLCNIPFFCIRLYLSNQCNICASSLLIKNLIYGFKDLCSLSCMCISMCREESDSDAEDTTEALLLEAVDEEQEKMDELENALKESNLSMSDNNAVMQAFEHLKEARSEKSQIEKKKQREDSLVSVCDLF